MNAPVNEVRSFMEIVLQKIGVPVEDVPACVDVLISSDLSGIESHGIGRFKMYYDRIKAGIQFPVTKIKVIQDSKAVAVWDGGHGMGQVVSCKAMQKAIDKAAEFGLGAVAVRNSTHFGICGYYAKMATRQNMAGLIFTNARPSVAPLFGVTPLLGTNPICFGAPSDLAFPFLFDAATSITQRGKIEVLAREEKDTPIGWAIDTDNQPYKDTTQLLKDLVLKKASLLPLGGNSETMGGHKGYGLSTMVEIFCAAFQQGSFLKGLLGFENREAKPYRLGHFFVAFNISSFIDVNIFKKTVGDIIRQLKDSQKSPDYDNIFVGGEKEYLSERKVLLEGIPIIDNLRRDLNLIKEELRLDVDYKWLR